MVYKEKLKLGLLATCLLVSLISLFTSHKTFQMGPRDLPQLQPQVQRFCSLIQKAKSKCLDRQKSGSRPVDYCQDIIHHASQCPYVVQQAYRYINMGGCPYELRDVTLCELERCGGYHGSGHDPFSQEGCVQHCDHIRKQLEACVRKSVEYYLQKYGLPVIQKNAHRR